MSMVYLIGAGPGDPGLITVRGMQCLRADLRKYLICALRHELVCYTHSQFGGIASPGPRAGADDAPAVE